jgi:predicted esterase
MPRAFLIVALSLAAACATRQVRDQPARPVAAVDASSEREPTAVDTNREGQPVQRAPSTPPGALRALEVEGFLPAVFFTPPGEAPARLVVTTHGAGGAPEWECEYWRQLTGDSAFVLSLRGKSMGGGSYFYPNHLELEAELNAAVRAARAADPRILPGGGIYSGYSQGASMGSVMLSRYGAAFPYLVLIEGFELWNIPRARAFAKSGGRRVLFACGTAQCSKVGEESVRWLQKAGLDARLEYVVGGGHTPAGQVMERVDAALPWLLGD